LMFTSVYSLFFLLFFIYTVITSIYTLSLHDALPISLGFCALDVSGRAFLVFDASFENPSVGTLDCCMVKEFFRALAFQAGITLHLKVLYGENDHHKIEGIFKAFAHALREAVTETDKGVLSSKGVL